MADKFSNWLVLNIKWIITIIIIGISNYFIIAGKVSTNTIHINTVEKRVIKIEKTIPKLQKKDEVVISLLKEVKFNPKRQMKNQGLDYIEDTNLGTK